MMRKGGPDQLGTYVYNAAFIEFLEQKQCLFAQRRPETDPLNC